MTTLKLRTLSRLTGIVLCLSALCLSGTKAAADTTAADTTAAAADSTSVFAPLKAQEAMRLATLKTIVGPTVRPAGIRLLVAQGLVDEAAARLKTLVGDEREMRTVEALVYLTRQDFARARPLIEAMAAAPEPTEMERRLRFQWLFAIDDAAQVDSLTRPCSLLPGTRATVPDLLAAGRLAYDLLNYARADSCFTRVLEQNIGSSLKAMALRGQGQVLYKQRDYDGSFAKLKEAVALDGSSDNLYALCETLIRMGRTDDAITACDWAIRFNPYSEMAHYMLGNGYARKNYTELEAAFPNAFADSTGRAALSAADRLLADGRRDEARAAYEAVRVEHPGWADAWVRMASLDFEDGKFDAARDYCYKALEICPGYGRAHATLAKALESQRFLVDVHRAGYERRFAAAPLPDVPGIDRFVLNWKSLSPRHQKRVALSIAPWKQFIPVLVAGGSTYYIKPLYMLLSETPGQETLKDQRISYDSRLWDDVRGAGGYHTVTGIEDVERTIFDRYNTVLHELTHQVHSVLTADQSRQIQELYRRAKERDDRTKDGFLSRYAGGSVFEYFAEGANALESPRRDAYDTREVVKERLEQIDPDLKEMVQRFFDLRDVDASYPVAFVNAGGDHLERGDVDGALPYYDKALERDPNEETALSSLVNALTLKGDGPGMTAAADRAVAACPASGPVAIGAANASWFSGRGLDAAITRLAAERARVRAGDRYQVDLALGGFYWTRGDGARSAAAYDSVLAYQSDNPEGLWGKASALALLNRWDEAFGLYEQAVRLRTGVVDLRCDYARDLIRAGRTEPARVQLDEARLLEAENPVAEALRGWLGVAGGDTAAARRHALKALAWGPWCDLARLVLGMTEAKAGNRAAAEAAVAPVRERIERNEPPGYVYRRELAVWQPVHEMPAVERSLLEQLGR